MASNASAAKKALTLLANRRPNRISFSGKCHGALASTPFRRFRNGPDKNEDNSEPIRPGPVTLVPDEVIEVKASATTVVPGDAKSEVFVVAPEDADADAESPEECWTPDPETGVFTPEEHIKCREGGNDSGGDHMSSLGHGSSVLRLEVYVRHVELDEGDRPPPATDQA